MREHRGNATPTREGPRANEDITAKQVRLIGAAGENIGATVITTSDRRKITQ